eukprot:5524374-Pyramimonas_sp.AAC.1
MPTQLSGHASFGSPTHAGAPLTLTERTPGMNKPAECHALGRARKHRFCSPASSRAKTIVAEIALRSYIDRRRRRAP